MDKKKYYKPSNITLNILIGKYFSNYIDELIKYILLELNLNEQEQKELENYIKKNKFNLITEKTLKKLY